MGYTKLFSDIILSTVWRESNDVRILWITMLALKDERHEVSASIPGLADAAKITVEECEKGLAVLSSPDKYSRSTEFEGRRIAKCDGGWLILNGEKYRQKRDLTERKEYKRLKQQEYRGRVDKRGQAWTNVDDVDNVDPTEHNITEHNIVKNKRSLTRFKKPSQVDVMNHFVAKGSSPLEASKFYNHYESNGWRVGKNPMKFKRTRWNIVQSADASWMAAGNMGAIR